MEMSTDERRSEFLFVSPHSIRRGMPMCLIVKIRLRSAMRDMTGDSKIGAMAVPTIAAGIL